MQKKFNICDLKKAIRSYVNDEEHAKDLRNPIFINWFIRSDNTNIYDYYNFFSS